MSLPGKKLMFMGGEFGQFLEWRFSEGLEWNVLENGQHQKLLNYSKTINHFYLENKPLWQIDDSWDGFEWINDKDSDNSVISFMRKSKKKNDHIIVVSNFTPVDRKKYTIGVKQAGEYEIVLDSASKKFGGEKPNRTIMLKAKKQKFNLFNYTISFDINGLSTLYIKRKVKPRTINSKEIKL